MVQIQSQLSLFALLIVGGAPRVSNASKTGRTLPPSTEKSINILLFPVYVRTVRQLYDTIESHLSLADHGVSYLYYEEDFPEYQESVSAKDYHVIKLQTFLTNHTQLESNALTVNWTIDVASIPASHLQNLSNRCDRLLNDKNLLDRLRRLRFDSIFVELQGNDVCGLILARKLKIDRVIGFSTTALNEPFTYYVGNPSFPSYIPTSTSPSIVHDSWNRRASNFYSYVKEMVFWQRNYFDNLAIMACRHLNNSCCPTVDVLYNDFDLVFVNSDVVLETPRPTIPSVIRVGGIITKVPQLFPKDMERTARLYRTGIILVTLQTSLAIDAYPKAFLDIFVDTFARFEHAIFWKANNGSVEIHSKNIFFQEEFEIQDIMGHARTRLVITVCDTDTVFSAVFHGVPVLCLPLLESQLAMARLIQNRGLGVTLTLDRLNVNNLMEAIQSIISNKTYRDNVRHSSKLLRERQSTPSDRLIFWTEYIIRHGGASHLRDRTSFQLSLIQLYLLDILVLPLAVICIVIIFGLSLTVVWMWGMSRNRPNRKNNIVKNKVSRKVKIQ